jgi:hypothetical protein
MSTLTRAEAYELVDNHADDRRALLAIAAAWELAGYWNAHAAFTADQLREHIDMCGMDDVRSNGPHDSDDTGLPMPLLTIDGMSHWDTGCGCTALGITLSDGRQVMVTADDDARRAPIDAVYVTVGSYDSDGLQIGDCTSENVADARAYVARQIATDNMLRIARQMAGI